MAIQGSGTAEDRKLGAVVLLGDLLIDDHEGTKARRFVLLVFSCLRVFVVHFVFHGTRQVNFRSSGCIASSDVARRRLYVTFPAAHTTEPAARRPSPGSCSLRGTG